MSPPEHLLDLWFAMQGATSDAKAFKSAQATFANQYKRADYRQQGEFHRLLSEHWRRLDPPRAAPFTGETS